MRERQRSVEPSEEPPSGRLARLRRRLPGRPHLFSVRAFAVALALAVAGVVLGGLLPLPGTQFLGLLVGAGVHGLLAARRCYVETATAGALTAGVGLLASTAFGVVLLPLIARHATEVAGIGAAAGAVVALLGHYLGRDLRAGLTRSL